MQLLPGLPPPGEGLNRLSQRLAFCATPLLPPNSEPLTEGFEKKDSERLPPISEKKTHDRQDCGKLLEKRKRSFSAANGSPGSRIPTNRSLEAEMAHMEDIVFRREHAC